jgi:heme/copper-type cytochrome/quinol oxidase subunit 2
LRTPIPGSGWRSRMNVARVAGLWTAHGVMGLALCLGGSAALAAQQVTPPPEPPETPDSAPVAAPVKRVVRTFKVYADNWSWTPDTMRVKQGDHVVLKLYAYRASRSFVLKGYRLDVHMPQDQEVVVEFDADRKGEFPFKCGRPRGNGCAKMRGTFFVD